MSPNQRVQILNRVQSIETREQARRYLAEVKAKLRAHRVVQAQKRVP